MIEIEVELSKLQVLEHPTTIYYVNRQLKLGLIEVRQFLKAEYINSISFPPSLTEWFILLWAHILSMKLCALISA